jgi:hypothetical protein
LFLNKANKAFLRERTFGGSWGSEQLAAVIYVSVWQ